MNEERFLIFVVEDDEWYNKLIVHNLTMMDDVVVESFTSGKKLLENLFKNPDVVTLDFNLPDIKGDELTRRIKNFNKNIEIIVISQQEKIETAVELLSLGAFDYIVKSNDIRERLLNKINNIRKNSRLRSRIDSLEQEVGKKYKLEHAITGNSEPMKRIIGLVEKATGSNINVTILGETGTGKEVVAKAIHYNSGRKGKPFVPVNITAIPSELFESELFGHEKGAFTGAISGRKGKFEEANGGTLFLDEIAEMDLIFQPKLLRALQEREITRVGSNKLIPLDCRIIVATNKNLKQEVEKGNFRQDLFYRLFGLQIELPPLRERDNDILLLASVFMEEFGKENNLSKFTLNDGAKQKLLSYNWPGNVRELRSVIELAMIMAENLEIKESDITLSSYELLQDVLSEELTLREYERKIVNFYLKKYNNDTKLVANMLGIGQTTIYRMLKE
jgi:two-component system, NtrC family, response regulator AtoC